MEFLLFFVTQNSWVIFSFVFQKLKLSLKKWAESEFKSDPQLNLIPSLYQKLKEEGHDFTDNSTSQVKVPVVLSKDPNVVSSQQEQDDIAKAIELSLKENKSSSPKTYSSPYVSAETQFPTNRKKIHFKFSCSSPHYIQQYR